MICLSESYPDAHVSSNSYLMNVLYLKFLLIIKKFMLFHCTGHLVIFLMYLIHLSLIYKKLLLIYLGVTRISY